MKKRTFRILSTFILVFFIAACKSGPGSQLAPPEIVIQTFPTFLNEGHRGASGLKPENTIPAMIKAIEEGANVIELDVLISKDNQVVVTHDFRLNRSITLLPNGEEIPEGDGEEHLIYQMNYSEIRKYDVGTKFYLRFPEEKSDKAIIPLLGDLIDSVEHFTAQNKYPQVIYNIEIKATPGQDGLYHPAPLEYTNLVIGVLKEKKLSNNRYYLQSFDIRILQQIKQEYPHVITGFLTGNEENSLEMNLDQLGFTPQIYSPNLSLATADLVEKSHKAGMKFVPWTVNLKADMERLNEMGVDGIITDYPNRLRKIRK